jgi:hypothetical protein
MMTFEEEDNEVSSIDQPIERQWDPAARAAPEQPVALGKNKNDVDRISLTRTEVWNVSFCLLAWAFAVCNVTLGKAHPFFAKMSFSFWYPHLFCAAIFCL